MKAAPYSVMLISYGLSIYSVNMCVMRNFSVILLFFTVFCCFYSNISCNSSGKIKDRKISCKVVPLKARPIIKADVIFSGTVLEVIKKPNLVLNFARRRRRRRRKIGKGKKLNMVFCYQNCSDLLLEKIVLVIEKNFWNSRLKAEHLQKFWDH